MSIRGKIFEFLKTNEATVREISEKMKLDNNMVNTYINQLSNKKLIEYHGYRNKGRIYRAVEFTRSNKPENTLVKELKFLYDFMSNKTSITSEPTPEEIEYVTKIKELIK